MNYHDVAKEIDEAKSIEGLIEIHKRFERSQQASKVRWNEVLQEIEALNKEKNELDAVLGMSTWGRQPRDIEGLILKSIGEMVVKHD